MVSANPDGYDFTFTEGNRLWRKNLRDNNGDGEIRVGGTGSTSTGTSPTDGVTTTRARRRLP